MLNLGMMEILLVLAVAFLIVGPKDLPKVARWLARQVRSLRRMIAQIKKETGWDEITKDITDTKTEVESVFREADVTADLKAASRAVQDGLNGVKQDIESN